MHEAFEHTADLGLRIRSPDLDTLFVEAAEALFSAIIEDLNSVQSVERVEINLTENDRELLLFDWLRDLLYRFDAEHQVFGRFEIHVRSDGLTGMAWGERFDPARHVPLHEVKAITYH